MDEQSDGDLAELQRLLGIERLRRAVQAWAGARRLPGGAAAAAARLQPAGHGITGFLGHHTRVELRVRDGCGVLHNARLFVKTIPCENRDKAVFIDENNFFRREALVYAVLAGAGANDWRPRAYLCDDHAVVLDDLSAAGCTSRPAQCSFDLAHARLTAAALARMHAACAALEEARGINYCLLREHAVVLEECNMLPGPWLSTGAHLTASLLREFDGVRGNRPGLASALQRHFEQACATLRYEPSTLNVLLHRDCWANNVLFEYEGEEPRRALLIDFQCVRYAPPAFDLALMLYLTTDVEFRREGWTAVRRHYWTAWCAAAETGDGAAAKRALRLGYDRAEFERRFEEARWFALVAACCICPYALMDSTAARCFDDPARFRHLTFEDRSGPVLEHARAEPVYRARLLELAHEYIQRYVAEEDVEQTDVTSVDVY